MRNYLNQDDTWSQADIKHSRTGRKAHKHRQRPAQVELRFINLHWGIPSKFVRLVFDALAPTFSRAAT